MPVVRAVRVIRYPTQGSYTETELLDPTWADVERCIREMDRFGQPTVFLQCRPGNTESDCMILSGGADALHVEADTNGDWVQAVNAERGTEEVEVWTSDQGFSTQARFTWPFESVLRLAHAYFEQGILDPGIPWRSARPS
jgi:hypothetical protein